MRLSSFQRPQSFLSISSEKQKKRITVGKGRKDQTNPPIHPFHPIWSLGNSPLLVWLYIYCIPDIHNNPILVILIFCFLLPCQCRQPLDVAAIPTDDGKALKVFPFLFFLQFYKCLQIDLNADHSSILLQHWLDQAMSGLMAAVATNK